LVPGAQGGPWAPVAPIGLAGPRHHDRRGERRARVGGRFLASV